MLFLLKLFASKKAKEALSNTSNYGAPAPAKHSLRPAYFILNFLRLCNIVTLVVAAVAEALMAGRTTRASGSGFYWFDALAHVITLFFTLFLIGAEIPKWKWLKKFYLKHWPLFSVRAGFFTFGICMVFLGCMILANISNGGDDNWDASTPLQPIATAAGLLCIIFGTISIPVGFLLYDKLAQIPSRLIREHGNAAVEKYGECVAAGQFVQTTPSLKHSSDLPRYSSQPGSIHESITKPEPAVARAGSHGSARSKCGPSLPINYEKSEPVRGPIGTDHEAYNFLEARPKYSSSFYGSERPMSVRLGTSSSYADSETNYGRSFDHSIAVPAIPEQYHRPPSPSERSGVWNCSVSQAGGRSGSRGRHSPVSALTEHQGQNNRF